MKSSGTYLSLKNLSEGLYKEKGSKFLAFAIPVTSTESAKEHIQELRDLHPKAVHVCFAWRIGIDKFDDRYSDDGEPNNSAGKPIFGQILAAEITNILIAVVRYYGGTKLGVGGLVSAYKTAAKEAIDQGEIIEKHEVVNAVIRFNPSNTGELMSLLNKLDIEILSHGFEGMDHLVKVEIKKNVQDDIINTFAQLPPFDFQIQL
ncbi:MAG: YigZ family protein [Crocinitomicaceae bacterium]|nr:YigZ family protein [Crocinitomicaceae bacterium]